MVIDAVGIPNSSNADEEDDEADFDLEIVFQ